MKTQNISLAMGSLKASLLCMILVLAGSLNAQVNSDNKSVSDTTEVYVGSKVIVITTDTITGKKDVQVKAMEKEESYSNDDEGDEDDKKVKRVDVALLNIDLGANWIGPGSSPFNSDNNFLFENDPLRSTHVGLHFLRTRINMAKGHIGLVTALTLDNNRYQFRRDITLQPDQASVTTYLDSVSFKKNKLISNYLEVPLLLSFQTAPSKPSKNFHLAVGGFAGLLVGGATKQKSDLRGKVKLQDDFNLAKVRYGLTARVGYRNFELYTNYVLTPLFEAGQGPAISSINFGIALTGMM